MIWLIIYIFILLIVLFIAAFTAFYLFFLIYSSLMGSPFVPSKSSHYQDTINHANLKKGQIFVDLGCGDGQVVRYAVKNYQVKGIGIDINPLLILLSKILTKLAKINNIEFKLANIYKFDLSKFDVVYFFLMPEMIKKLVPKLNNEINNNCLLISHGFKIPCWDKYLIKTIKRSIFSSYFYKKRYD